MPFSNISHIQFTFFKPSTISVYYFQLNLTFPEPPYAGLGGATHGWELLNEKKKKDIKKIKMGINENQGSEVGSAYGCFCSNAKISVCFQRCSAKPFRRGGIFSFAMHRWCRSLPLSSHSTFFPSQYILIR